MPTGPTHHHPHTPTTTHNQHPTLSPKEAKSTKNWGQADRDLLEDLTNRQLIDITDTTNQNIEQDFWHRDKKNFRKNFGNYSAAWDLEIEYSGARCNRGKMRHLILLIFLPVCVL
jgi:hypothetical protein